MTACFDGMAGAFPHSLLPIRNHDRLFPSSCPNDRVTEQCLAACPAACLSRCLPVCVPTGHRPARPRQDGKCSRNNHRTEQSVRHSIYSAFLHLSIFPRFVGQVNGPASPCRTWCYSITESALSVCHEHCHLEKCYL